MRPVIIAVFWLAYIHVASSACCTSLAILNFNIRGGVCGAVGAKSNGSGCQIKICANGEALVGTYCGKAACDIFGCDCIKGCLQGNFAQDFLKNNFAYGIELLGSEMVEACYLCQFLGNNRGRKKGK
ncbi:protein Diedel [Drosophila ficusphila]|uniref:protein Diedel n=1 Tax=Drosophila ficusphila TaxID=30025 RepID=UPI0007E7C7A4|nr:protein Diedel [Drosophila ficusphila]